MKSSWHSMLETNGGDFLIKKVLLKIMAEANQHGKTIYPGPANVFKSLDYFELSETKVVIIGQDPYHGEGQANGLAFSVDKNITPPPSLKNIFKEIERDLNVTVDRENGDLTHWAEQGVLLLNTILTVEKDKPLSHIEIGWQDITNKILNAVMQDKSPKVFMLWGKKAQELFSTLQNTHDHLILETSHPSPFSVERGFNGCNHFSKANEFLNKHNVQPINWK